MIMYSNEAAILFYNENTCINNGFLKDFICHILWYPQSSSYLTVFVLIEPCMDLMIFEIGIIYFYSAFTCFGS